jgi:hypothetical protein
MRFHALRRALLPALVLATSPLSAQLGDPGAHLLQQALDGLPGTSEAGDRLGAALAVGDFDGDGHDDLAIGAPAETPAGGANWSGQVTVVYGGDSGLEPASGEEWSLDDTSFGPSGELDHFGEALAAGDFDADGYDDLAIGAPDREIDGEDQAGLVVVLYGGPGGLTTVSSQDFYPSEGGLSGALEAGDWFGEELAAGDFDGDGYDDLVVGAPGEGVGDLQPDAGAVHVVYGTSLGLSTNGEVDDQLWTQSSTLVSTSHANAVFGRALTVGAFDGDGFDDLAIGSPWADFDELQSAGSVTVLYGTGTGLATAGAQHLVQSGLLPGEPQWGAQVGAALAAGDFDADGDDDLAIGAPRTDLDFLDDVLANAGIVLILDGAPSGLTSAGALLIDRSEGDYLLDAEDEFGFALAAGQFDGGRIDLAVGAPGYAVNTEADAGLVFAFGNGVFAPTSVVELSQGTGPGAVEPGDRVGSVLVAGDFDGNGFDDLAIGVPDESASGANDAGVAAIYYSQGLFRDDFESFDLGAWSGSLAN